MPFDPPAALDPSPAIYWMRERESLRVRKERGDPPPWTEDQVLQEWSFCCPRREDDKVTRWIAKYIRQRFADHPNLWIMLAIGLLINCPPSLAELMSNRDTWPFGEFSPAALGA